MPGHDGRSEQSTAPRHRPHFNGGRKPVIIAVGVAGRQAAESSRFLRARLSLRPASPGGAPVMKLVIAVIKPFKPDDVPEALNRLGVSGMTVSEVKGYGRQKGHTEIYRGAEYVENILAKVRIEVAVPPDGAHRAGEAITAAARTGQIGDGKIFVIPIDHALRIRTGETDSDAL